MADKSRIKTVSFQSDQFMLKGTLHLPQADQPPIVIGCHGLLADRSSPKQIGLANACVDQGIAFFRFDHRGCGDSQGEFESVTTLEARHRDLLSAIRLMRSMNVFNEDIGLFGSSMGGTVCLSLAGVEAIASVVTFAAPLHSRFSNSAGRQMALSFDITKDIRKIRNIHIFHGEHDEIVPLSHAKTLYTHAARPKRLTVLSNGDHRMSDPSHQKVFIRDCIDWFIKSFFQKHH